MIFRQKHEWGDDSVLTQSSLTTKIHCSRDQRQETMLIGSVLYFRVWGIISLVLF